MSYKDQKNAQEFPFKIKIPGFVSVLLGLLNRNGFNAFVVGGAIRNALLERKATDWDISTDAEDHEIKSVFKNFRKFSLKHETVTLVHSGKLFEVTKMKGTEGEKGDIFSDLSHRDFTLNAMAYDETKSVVIDPHGGFDDLKNKTIRAVGNPVDRFREDPLRMMRAVRIAGELNFKIEKSTLDAINSRASSLTLVSVERIRDELIKIILCKRPSNLLELLCKTGLMGQILPELLEGYGMEQNSWHKYTVFRHTIETVENVPADPVLRLAALLHDIGKPRVVEEVRGENRFFSHEVAGSSMAKEIMERLRFSREEVNKVTSLTSMHMIDYSENWSDAAVRRLIRRAGRDSIDELLALRKADIKAHGVVGKKLDIFAHLERRIEKMKDEEMSIDIMDLAVDGKKVMDILEIDPGPEVGRVLERLLELIIENPELNSEEKLVGILNDFRHNPR